mgnify:CR=1 FL=1
MERCGKHLWHMVERKLLGYDIVAEAREKIIKQYANYIQDLLLFYENKYSDILTLERVKLSAEFLRKDLSE